MMSAMDDTESTRGEMGDSGELAVAGVRLAGSAFPPEWIELIPAGDFKGRDGRGPFRMTHPGQAIAATKALQMSAGLPIDYDHATDLGAPEGRPAPAAGWICGLEDRDGALWGQVEWTAHGADAVVTKEYRYISPVFEYTEDGEVVRLLRAALTNNPNLYLTAISARRTQPGAETKRASHQDLDLRTNNMENFAGELKALLELPADASMEAVLEAIKALVIATEEPQSERLGGQDVATHGSDADRSRFVPIAQFECALTELNHERAARRREQAEQAVANAIRNGRLSPSQHDWAIDYCQADANGFAKFIAKQSPLLGIAERAEGAFTLAKHGTSLPAADGIAGGVAARLNAAELAICSRLGIKPNEYVKHKTPTTDFLA
jgi:phage I-like protein